MFPRITNASDINRPIIGTQGKDQTDQSAKIQDDYDYQLTPKKLVLRIIKILFVLGITVWALYHIFFVFDFGTIPAKELSANEIEISSDQILSFQLTRNDDSVSDDFEIGTADFIDGVQYITAKQPFLSLKNSDSKTSTEALYRKCELSIEDVTAVYYIGKNRNDTFLIWEQ